MSKQIEQLGLFQFCYSCEKITISKAYNDGYDSSIILIECKRCTHILEAIEQRDIYSDEHYT